jgi:sugar lactone lactonase YvrE
MGDNSDQILRTYMENVLRLQQERNNAAMSDQELKQIALDAGMSEDDLEFVRQRLQDCLNRGQGFIRYENWSDAIAELEKGVALAPYNIDALNALATAYAGRWRDKHSHADRDQARSAAERVLAIDSKNDSALRTMSALSADHQEHFSGMPNGRPLSSDGQRMLKRVLIGAAVAAAIVVVLIRHYAYDDPKPTADTLTHLAVPPTRATPTEPKRAPNKSKAEENVAFTFGKEGIGPGQFTDARSIAVDGAGRVYVAEYSSGRNQAFDSAGNYLRQWNIGKNNYVRGMAGDKDGHLYIVYNGRINRYDGATGDLIDEVKYPGGPGFTSVSVMGDGGLVAGWDGLWKGGMFVNVKSQDNLVIFDRNLHAIKTVKQAISSVSENVVFSPQVAVDGLGNIYMVAETGDAIYHFTPQGKYIDKFGSPGAGPEQLHGARGIAVNGSGHIFVSGFSEVQEFDGNGQFIRSVKVPGTGDDLAFNMKDELYVVARTKVMKLAL